MPLLAPPPETILPTEQQRRAIEAPMGPVLVVAGPGAGKTFCLIGRVGFLLARQKLPPQRICAVTFTNKAAEEIAKRLHREVGHAAEDLTRGTLHSLCLRILREYGERMGLKRGFGIADDAYQLVVLARMEIPRKRRKYVVEDFGRHRLQGLHLAPDTERLYQRYRAYLAKQNLIDFDDIIALTRDLLEKHPDVADAVARRWDYLLVDEFQDLNPAQYDVLRKLAAPHGNFFAVGDDEQSIFSWTGADPAVLKRFQRDYGIAAPIVLDENRRSARAIFDAARRLLGVNPRLFDKQLTASRESPFPVRAVRFRDEEAEAAWVVDDLLADRAEHGLGWGDYGVLYRRHSVGRQLETTLVRRGVPCRMARGRSLQDDPIVGYVVASLRVIANPGDPAAIEACAPLLLPEDLIERVRADAGGGSFLEALRAMAAVRPREDPDRKKMWRFIFHIENLQAIRRGQSTLEPMVEELLSQFSGRYRNRLEDRHDELTDPADLPEVVELAGRLASVPTTGVWIEPAKGQDIALRGMLRAAGIPVAREPDRASYVLAAHPVMVFKALQLLHSREFRESLDDYVTFDLETTGKDPATCEIIEIGAARVVRGQVTARFQSLVHTSVPISAGASETHGYTAQDLAGAPRFADVWPRFRAFVGPSTLVAHNAQKFDVPVLRKAAADLPGIGDLVFLDTFPLARSLYRESASLTALAQRFGITGGRAHHAEDDAVTLAAVFQKLGHAKVVRARKTSLTNLLDHLGLALAFEPRGDAETELLRGAARGYTLGRFSDCLEAYATDRELDGRTDAHTVDWVIEQLGGAGLMERIRAKKTASQRYPEAMARLRRLLEASRADSADDGLARFLERVALSSSEGVEADPHRVNLLTLHSTKGLEFSRVYILGVEDDQLPGERALAENRKGEIEEHRRLLYVGMTRAKDRLVMTRVDARSGRPAGGNRFLDEMGVKPSAPTLPPAAPGPILKPG